jgi:hypothetical protein
MSSVTELLDEMDRSPIPFIEARMIGYLAAAHPELFREALDTIARYEAEKAQKANES